MSPYTFCADMVDADDGSSTQVSPTTFPTLAQAREAYATARREVELRGFRFAHARIVGPIGEVYDPEPPSPAPRSLMSEIWMSNNLTEGDLPMDEQNQTFSTASDDVLRVIQRIVSDMQTTRTSRERALAITKLEEAAHWLQADIRKATERTPSS